MKNINFKVKCKLYLYKEQTWRRHLRQCGDNTSRMQPWQIQIGSIYSYFLLVPFHFTIASSSIFSSKCFLPPPPPLLLSQHPMFMFRSWNKTFLLPILCKIKMWHNTRQGFLLICLNRHIIFEGIFKMAFYSF